MNASAQVSKGTGAPFGSACGVGRDPFAGVADERLAATNLQKSVLFGFERHCSHVPGPFTQGSELAKPLANASLDLVNIGDGGLRSSDCGLSLDSSAQTQVPPFEQNPQGSGGVIAVTDDVEVLVVRAGLCGVAN